MDVTKNDDGVLYVTLVQAAEEVGGSPEDIRTAARRKRIRAVKENPKNKRSRWLVALEDVRNLDRVDEEDTSEVPSSIAPPSALDVVGEEWISSANGLARLEAEPRDQQTPEPTPEDEAPDSHDTPAPEDNATDPEHPETEPRDEQTPQVLNPTPDSHDTPAPEDDATDPIDNHLAPFPVGDQIDAPQSIVRVAPDRGEELIGRLIDSIDRFSDAVPEAPFDYQALLDNYVAAVEQRSRAEVHAATLQRRLDDTRDQAADYSLRLEQTQAQNRQLLSELEIAKAAIENARDHDEGDEARPLWKRRNRR